MNSLLKPMNKLEYAVSVDGKTQATGAEEYTPDEQDAFLQGLALLRANPQRARKVLLEAYEQMPYNPVKTWKEKLTDERTSLDEQTGEAGKEARWLSPQQIPLRPKQRPNMVRPNSRNQEGQQETGDGVSGDVSGADNC